MTRCPVVRVYHNGDLVHAQSFSADEQWLRTGQGYCIRVFDGLTMVERFSLTPLPVHAIKDALGDTTRCTICLDAMSTALEGGLTVLHCRHAFHGPCITTWFNRGKDCCPICHERRPFA